MIANCDLPTFCSCSSSRTLLALINSHLLERCSLTRNDAGRSIKQYACFRRTGTKHALRSPHKHKKDWENLLFLLRSKVSSMARVTPVPYAKHILALRQDFDSFLSAGHSFLNSLLSPDPTSKSNGKATTAITTPLVEGTTSAAHAESASPTAPPVAAVPTQNPQTTTAGITTTADTSFPTSALTDVQSQFSITSELNTFTSGASSNSQLSYPTSDSSATPSVSSNSYLVSPNLGVSIAPSVSTSNIAVASASPRLPKYSSNAGPIAAAVTIAIVLSLSIAILVFVFIRRRRTPKQTAWKSTSRSPSLLSVSSDRPTIEYMEEPKAIPQPLASQSTASEAIDTPPLSHFNGGSRLGSGSFSRHQGLNTASSVPEIRGPQLRDSQSTLVQHSTEHERPHSEVGITPGKRNDMSLPLALIAGRVDTSEFPAYSGFSGHELRLSPPSPKRSLDRPGPRQVFFPVGVTTPSTPSEGRNEIRRKPVPKRNAVDAGA